MSSLQGKKGLNIETVYGGTDIEKQAKLLDKGVDVIVGTPGRVIDMSKRGHIDLPSIEIFCLDEADRMLDMGFFPDVLWIVERMTIEDADPAIQRNLPSRGPRRNGGVHR